MDRGTESSLGRTADFLNQGTPPYAFGTANICPLVQLKDSHTARYKMSFGADTEFFPVVKIATAPLPIALSRRLLTVLCDACVPPATGKEFFSTRLVSDDGRPSSLQPRGECAVVVRRIILWFLRPAKLHLSPSQHRTLILC